MENYSDYTKDVETYFDETRMRCQLFSQECIDLIKADDPFNNELVVSYLLASMMDCSKPECLLDAFTQFVYDNVSIEDECGQINYQFNRALMAVKGNFLTHVGDALYSTSTGVFDKYRECLHMIMYKGDNLMTLCFSNAKYKNESVV